MMNEDEEFLKAIEIVEKRKIDKRKEYMREYMREYYKKHREKMKMKSRNDYIRRKNRIKTPDKTN